MDELDLLKKDWKRKEQELPKLSYDEIHKMIWKRSSSIVKWIFVISIVEFMFWGVISFTLKDTDGMLEFQELNHMLIIRIFTYTYYVALLGFMYLFFMNYKRISANDSVKDLLKNILRTRKTVNYYVWFNLLYFAVLSLIIFVIEINYDSQLINLHEEFIEKGKESLFYVLLYGISFIYIVICCLVIWLFYKLIYGILLKKLNKNYQELKQKQIEN